MRIGLEYFQEHNVTLVLVDNGARTVAFVAEGKWGYDDILTMGDILTVDEFFASGPWQPIERLELAVSLINKLTEKVNWELYL